MRRNTFLWCGVFTAFGLFGSVTGRAGDEFRPLMIQKETALAVGRVVPNLHAKSETGKDVPLDDGKAKWTIVAFLSTRCPCTARYLTRLQTISREFSGQSVRIVGVNANANERADDVVRYAHEQKLTFPLLKDADSSVVRTLHPQNTPEIFILDAERKIRFHGPVDDSLYGDDIHHAYLRDALTALTQGRPPAAPSIAPFGCAIFVPKPQRVNSR